MESSNNTAGNGKDDDDDDEPGKRILIGLFHPASPRYQFVLPVLTVWIIKGYA